MERLSKIILVIIISLLFPGLAVAGCADSTPGIGRVAPDFKLSSLDGQSVSLSDFRGRPVLINFWATWCGPCRYEMPFLQQVYEDAVWVEKGLVVLAVDIGESPVTVKDFVEFYGLTFPVLLDINQKVKLEYNVRNIPTTFLVDADGVIQSMKIGAFSGKVEIERALSKIIPR
jgi:thiol-disulfide isomerase/thioredoxin